MAPGSARACVALLVGVCAATLVACSETGRGASADELREAIPEPRLDGVEAAVAQQIRARRTALEAQPEDASRWGHYAMALDAHGHDAAAEVAYGRAAALNPREFRWPYFQAALAELSSLERAITLYRRSLEIDDAYAPAHLRLAQALERMNRHDEARASFERVQQLEPGNAFAPLGLGTIALRLGDVNRAIPLLERAYELDPEIHATVSALANAYHRAGDTERGRRLAVEARDLPRITYNQDDLRAEIKELAVDRRSYVRRAVVYRDVGQLDRALREAREARAKAPDDVQTGLLVADLEYRIGDYGAAETSAREALRLAPHRVDLRELLARVLYQRGAIDEAETLARQVLAEEDEANMHVLLGRVMGQRGDDAKAIEHLERAVELRPQEGEWRLTLAQVLIAVGRAERGRFHLRRLVADEPEHSVAWSTLGRCELELGDRAAATRAFERALETARGGAETEAARAGMAGLNQLARK